MVKTIVDQDFQFGNRKPKTGIDETASATTRAIHFLHGEITSSW